MGDRLEKSFYYRLGELTTTCVSNPLLLGSDFQANPYPKLNHKRVEARL
jgi:hypothetical protein